MISGIQTPDNSLRQVTVKLSVLGAYVVIALFAINPCFAQSSPSWTVGGDDAIGTELGARARVFRLPKHLLVIERDAPFLKLITLDGLVRQEIGRLGGGPGEFRQPSAAFFDSTRGELLVVDGAAVRVSVFELGDSLRFLRSLVAPEPRLEGVCRLRGRLFGLVRNSSTMLRELSIEDDRLIVRRAFGEPRSLHPLAEVPAVRNEASGSLVCDEPRGELVVISRTLGEVHRIAVESPGHSLAALPGFVPVPFVVRDGVLSAEIRQGDTFDVVSNLVTQGSEVIVVVARGTQTPQGRRIDGYFTYTLESGLAAGPPILRAWGQVGDNVSHVVCLREEPIPALAMFAGRRCPAR